MGEQDTSLLGMSRPRLRPSTAAGEGLREPRRGVAQSVLSGFASRAGAGRAEPDARRRTPDAFGRGVCTCRLAVRPMASSDMSPDASSAKWQTAIRPQPGTSTSSRWDLRCSSFFGIGSWSEGLTRTRVKILPSMEPGCGRGGSAAVSVKRRAGGRVVPASRVGCGHILPQPTEAERSPSLRPVRGGTRAHGERVRVRRLPSAARDWARTAQSCRVQPCAARQCVWEGVSKVSGQRPRERGESRKTRERGREGEGERTRRGGGGEGGRPPMSEAAGEQTWPGRAKMRAVVTQTPSSPGEASGPSS